MQNLHIYWSQGFLIKNHSKYSQHTGMLREFQSPQHSSHVNGVQAGWRKPSEFKTDSQPVELKTRETKTVLEFLKRLPKEVVSLIAEFLVQVRKPMFKVLFVGACCAGKSSLIKSYCEGTYVPVTMATIGIDFRQKNVYIPPTWGQPRGNQAKLQFWDTAGQERFDAVSFCHLRGVHAVMVVYSVVSRTSFEKAELWLARLRDREDPALCILVGNMSDRVEDRQVTNAEGEALANRFNVRYCEMTAKDSVKVDQLFKTVTEALLMRHPTSDTKTEEEEVQVSVQKFWHICMCSCCK